MISLSLSLSAQIKDVAFFPKTYKHSDIKGISILDVKEVFFEEENEIAFSGVSALAYSQEKVLYALSDRGYLYHLDVEIDNRKIEKLLLKKRIPLKNKKSKILKNNDAEGMAWSEKGLIISFERDPKISLFDVNARKINNLKIPKVLRRIKNYQKKNRALESVVFHPRFGLVTAPESALKHEDETSHVLYALDRRWKFKAQGKITSLEVMPDNKVLILQREFDILKGHTITLSTIDLEGCTEQWCQTETLASMKSEDGWNLDNFEGLTWIRDDLYLMISDDNENFLQKCIMILFEVKGK